jgi:hypothetical protein
MEGSIGRDISWQTNSTVIQILVVVEFLNQ